MACNTASALYQPSMNDHGHGGLVAGDTAPSPPPSSPDGRAAASLHGKPTSTRYVDRPTPLGTRLFGLGGTALVCLAILGATLFKWSTNAPPVLPAALNVFEVAEPQTPPAPDTDIPPSQEQAQKQETVREQTIVKASPPLVQIPATSHMAAPPVEPAAAPGPPVERPAAPAPSPQPPAAKRDEARPTWEGQVLAALNRAKRYPREASFRRQQGVPWIRFVMDREGRVRSVRLERPSGFDALDREAQALPMRAQPLPKPPESVTGDRIELVVPVEFFL